MKLFSNKVYLKKKKNAWLDTPLVFTITEFGETLINDSDVALSLMNWSQLLFDKKTNKKKQQLLDNFQIKVLIEKLGEFWQTH